jgi:hypothetical protein
MQGEAEGGAAFSTVTDRAALLAPGGPQNSMVLRSA